jgi:hypothetical protein
MSPVSVVPLTYCPFSAVKQGPTGQHGDTVTHGGVPAFIAIIEEDGERVLFSIGPAYGVTCCDVTHEVQLIPPELTAGSPASV